MPNPAPTLLSQFSNEVAGLIAAAAPATVAITAKGRDASGLFWRPNVVVTASEAIEADIGAKVEVISHAGPAHMTFAGRDPATDVAILTSDTASGTPLQLATEAAVTTGEIAIVAGRSAHGVSCAVGFVTLAGEAWESMRGGKIDRRIRLDTRLGMAQEGGPVLNAHGVCIGMAVLGPHRRTLVIPAATIERIAPQLVAHGRIKQGYLGIAGQPVRPQPIETTADGRQRKGLLVLSMDLNGPAQRAGLVQGDIITAIAGRAISSPLELRRALGPDTVGHSVTCEIIRAGKPATLTVTVGDRYARAANEAKPE